MISNLSLVLVILQTVGYQILLTLHPIPTAAIQGQVLPPHVYNDVNHLLLLMCPTLAANELSYGTSLIKMCYSKSLNCTSQLQTYIHDLAEILTLKPLL